MSPAVTQMILAVMAGCLCVSAATIMGRRGRLTLRYTAGWALLGLSAIVFGALAPFLERISSFFNLSPAGLVLVGSLTLVLSILFMVSLSVVGLKRDVQNLVESLALLRAKLDEYIEERKDDS